MQSKHFRPLSILLLVALLFTLAAPVLAQGPTGATPGSREPKLACTALTGAEQQEFDSLTALKDASTLAGADLARYDVLAQQINCYAAQLTPPVQPDQPKGATRETPEVVATVGSGGTYLTLKAAFDDINAGAGGLTGAIQLDIVGDTTETAPAVLNASGSGSASYTSVLIQPSGGAARTISGAITAGSPLIDLNGADNVMIDGLNSGGNALTIANTTVSATTGTATIRFIGGATNNTVTNSMILGSFGASVATNGGNIYFATDALTANGNDNNTISNNSIGPAGANLPTKGVYSNGSTTTTAINNSGNVITNNNIYDYFGAAVTSAGVYIAGGSTDFTISNNKFYQTATRTQTTGGQHSAIWIANTSGNNFQVTDNTIGYASSAGTGIYNFVGASSSSKLIAIYLNVAATTASSVQGNIITAINISGVTGGTGTTGAFMGISVPAGLANIGNVTGNTIGSLTSAGAISVTSNNASAMEVYGIYYFPSAVANVLNNNVGGIAATNSGAGSLVFYGIRAFTSSSVTNTMQNNTIGSTAAPITNTSSSTSSRTIGLYCQSGACVATGNTISNLSMNGGNVGTGASAAVIGLWIDDSSATIGNNVAQNIIYALSNSNASAAVWVTGLQYNGATTGSHLVQRNFIYNLSTPSTSATATVNGINVQGGLTTFQNNMIALGSDMTANSPQINGIAETIAGTDNFYFNSVYIGGSGVAAGSANSFAFQSSITTNTRNYRDNIFFNARSNGAAIGKHYAMRVGGSAPNPAGLTSNNNVLYATGTGGFTGLFNAVDQATLTNWQTATGQDAASFSSDPQFLSPTAATPNLHINPSIVTVIEGNGFLIGSVVDDYDGQTRASLTPTDIGADAGNFLGADLTPPAITYTALGSTASTANRVLVATITDVTGVPTAGALQPRIYYKKGAGTWFSSQGSLASGSGTNGTWNFTIVVADMGGVAMADVISYYVIAQDTAGTPNIGSNPAGVVASDVNTVTTPPAVPNSYTIVTAFSGSYNVGTGETYTSLTNAGGIFEAINAGALTGNVTINITTDLSGELGTNALNQWAEDGVGGYTMLIKPSGAPRIITGSNTGALIKLNGADRVRIDGSTAAMVAEAVGGNPALRELTIQNTNTGTSAVVIAVQSGTNGAQNNTLKNVNVLGQDPTTTLVGIALGGNTPGTAGTDNDGNRIENCTVKRVLYGIYSAGASAANPNTGSVITMNDLSATTTDRVRRVGIVVFNEDGIQITENSVGGIDTNESADAIGIGVGTQGMDATTTASGGVTNAFVSRNKVNGVNSASTVGFSAGGIAVAGAAGGANTIVNNMITGVTAPSTSPDLVAGIFVMGATGSTTQLYYNAVSMTGDRGTVASQMPSYGVAVTGADPTVVSKNNIFYTTQTSGGGVNARSYAIGMVSTTFANLDSNYNDFYFSGANAGGYRTGSLSAAAGTDYAALAAWQAAVADDANSIEADPIFVDPTNDLHIDPSALMIEASPVTGAGTPIAGINIDFDGTLRNPTTPDIGADEVTPLATILASFDARGGVDRVAVTWETASELDTAGFNLYRADDSVGPQTLLAYLPSQAPGSVQGFAYSYEDLAVQPGQTYWYWLEIVSLGGATTLHGPISATMSTPTAVTVSGMSAGEETGSAALPATSALLALLLLAGALAVRRGQQQNRGH